MDPFEAGGQDLIAPVAVQVRDPDPVQYGQAFVDRPDLDLVARRTSRKTERPQMCGCRSGRAVRAGTEQRGVHQLLAAAAVQVSPTQPVHDRVDRDPPQRPAACQIARLLEQVDLAPTAGIVEIESAGDRQLDAAVHLVHGQIDVPGRGGQRAAPPAGVFIPVDAIGGGGKGQHVGPAIAADVGHRHLVARGKSVDLVASEFHRPSRQQRGNHDTATHGGTRPVPGTIRDTGTIPERNRGSSTARPDPGASRCRAGGRASIPAGRPQRQQIKTPAHACPLPRFCCLRCGTAS